MKILASHPLAPLTTFHIGGPAHTLIEVHAEEDIPAALAHARESGLPLYVLGAGSNVLVPDAGVTGVVVRVLLRDIALHDDGACDVLVAGAGAPWEEVVDAAVARGLCGIENLAGIPGTMGGAAVQNIGAYGAELSEVFAYADTIDAATGIARRVPLEEAAFAYRSSFFKSHPELIIMRVALRLAKHAPLTTAYADLARAEASGVSLATPADVARAIRAIRAGKFPDITREGTAGSFFKNPIVSPERAAELGARFPGLPAFPHVGGMKL
ncbi:MAG TPA: UDP-N-acetylmuramate dehydrogenase, partial [Candidatus Paceibacterota bacterium]|nr:UDP-N-acetylmuramate dehydrogenase [Candidatus Paceibacterota bacterium]